MRQHSRTYHHSLWFARVLSHYPYVVLTVVLVVVTTCLIVSLTVGPVISFDDPLLGFEPRGTEIAHRMVTYRNLLENDDGRTDLLPFSPQQRPHDKDFLAQLGGQPHKRALFESDGEKDNYINNRHKRSQQPGFGETNHLNINALASNESFSSERFFCGVPDKRYAKIIVAASSHESLLNVDDLHAMCDMETTIFHPSAAFRDICIMNNGHCCPSWSIARYVALLQEKQSCRDITVEDVTAVKSLLIKCSPFYLNFTLEPNCDEHTDAWFHDSRYSSFSCNDVPAACYRYNAVYHILQYLTESSFISSAVTASSASSSKPSFSTSLPIQNPSPLLLKHSTIFLPIVAGSASVDFFKHFDNIPRNYKGLKVVAAHFDIKYTLFERYLILDSVWLGMACGIIFVMMWLYTTSIFITVMTFLSMFWAIEVAYFIYTFVFKIKFFPYMNMATLIIMIGIGADDLFVYCKIWHLAKAEKNNGVLEKIVSDTLRHTTLSMAVTSLTTMAAFYANYITDITAIRCFSVFAGTCILVNLILTITWLPASVMLYEKWCRCCVGISENQMCNIPFKLYQYLCDLSRIFFEKLLPCLVIKFRYFWILIYGALWIASIVVIFYNPRFKLPSSNDFQVFNSDHLLERFDLEYSKKFEYERGDKAEDIPMFPITLVWGVLAKDNGDYLNPHDKGSLTLDPEFDFTSKLAQRWILEFCSRLRHTEFVLTSPGFHPTECFMENFVRNFMKRPCPTHQQQKCCNETFPFHPSTFVSCLSAYINYLQKTPGVHYNTHSAGPRFHKGKISAFFVQFLSNKPFTYSYQDAHSFYLQVNRWVTDELLRAPPEMRRGWFVSHLSFYDLQSSLAVGTPMAVGVSLCVVAVVSFFTTLNVLISIYALMAVAATICVTIASLVLLDWELNILESVVVTVSIGLAIDLTLHYGVAFRLAPDFGRELRVISSLGRMGCPIAMAALTSFLAGGFMMPSTVLVYQKFGIFLMLLVTIAWGYATFFFQSLLRCLGPDGGFGQFHWPASDCCSPGSRSHIDKTIYALSESTLSSSSTSTRERSHSYSNSRELEPLTDSDNRRKSGRYHNCSQPRSFQNNYLTHDIDPHRHTHQHHQRSSPNHDHQHQHHHSHPHHHHNARRSHRSQSSKGDYTPVPVCHMKHEEEEEEAVGVSGEQCSSERLVNDSFSIETVPNTSLESFPSAQQSSSSIDICANDKCDQEEDRSNPAYLTDVVTVDCQPKEQDKTQSSPMFSSTDKNGCGDYSPNADNMSQSQTHIEIFPPPPPLPVS